MQNVHDMTSISKEKRITCAYMDFVVDFRTGLGHIDRLKAQKFVTL